AVHARRRQRVRFAGATARRGDAVRRASSVDWHGLQGPRGEDDGRGAGPPYGGCRGDGFGGCHPPRSRDLARKAGLWTVARPWAAASLPSVGQVPRPPTVAWTDRDRAARCPDIEARVWRSVHTDPQALLLPDSEKTPPPPRPRRAPT